MGIYVDLHCKTYERQSNLDNLIIHETDHRLHYSTVLNP